MKKEPTYGTKPDRPFGDAAQALDGEITLARIPVEFQAGPEAPSRDKEVYSIDHNTETLEVAVSSNVDLGRRERVTHPADWEMIQELAERLQGTTVVHINPTKEGGGVAMILPTEVDMMNRLGVDAHWYVMNPMPEEEQDSALPYGGNPFKFTKRMHNVSQRMSDEHIDEEGKAVHHRWAVGVNAEALMSNEPVQQADIFVIHDPQPAPLISRLRELNPTAKFVWRNHIDTDGELMADPTTPQGEVASYLLDECGVRDVDAIIAHPVDSFVHKDPELAAKTYFAPATFDPFDNLNRHLSPEEEAAGIDFINHEITTKNAELLAAGRVDDVQPLLDTDPSRQRMTLVARFDPSKGMEQAMEMGVQTRRLLREQGVTEAELPEVVIIGNGSVDDPDGTWMLEEMMRVRRDDYPDEKHGIVLARLRHNYDAINALVGRSDIVMQTSYAEGLETRVSDAIKHGKPVVVSDRGGIKTQVVEGESGMVLDFSREDYDLPRGAAYMAELLSDQELYDQTAQQVRYRAADMNLREFTTSANVARMMRIFDNVLNERPADRVWRMSEFTGETGPVPSALGFAATSQCVA